MGLRNGEALNALCPERCGPSDIDHVIHNMRVSPERVAFFEYKDEGVLPSQGQLYLARSLSGRWREVDTGRLLTVRFEVLWPSQESRLAEAASWVWPSLATLPS